MNFKRAIKSVAISSSILFLKNKKNGGKSLQNRPSPALDRFESKYSCIFQELMDRGKHAYVVTTVKYASGKSSYVSNISCNGANLINHPGP